MEKRIKILVADDEPEIVAVIEKVLLKTGYEVLKANNGKEAISSAEGDRPDLVLLDIRMPGMDGFQVCRALRKDPRNEKVPIIMLTACGKESDIVHALEEGADDYLVKPVDLDVVLKKVQSLLAVAENGTLPSQAHKDKAAKDKENSGKG